MTENIDPEILAAQRNLEQKRQVLQINSTPCPSPLASLLETSLIVLQSGEPEERPEWCGRCNRWPCYMDVEECQAQVAEEKERKRVAAARKLQQAIGAVKIGARYNGATFGDFCPPNQDAQKIVTICQRYAETFADRLKGCDNLLMLGSPGTGKNMLAACVCQEVVTSGYTALHTTAIKLVRRIKETWGKGKEETEQQAINLFSVPDLLVIDEVGVQFGSETERILLFEVVNERYEQMRPTIIISNLNVQEVEKYLGPRIMDRFYEGKSSVLEFNWESYRRRK